MGAAAAAPPRAHPAKRAPTIGAPTRPASAGVDQWRAGSTRSRATTAVAGSNPATVAGSANNSRARSAHGRRGAEGRATPARRPAIQDLQPRMGHAQHTHITIDHNRAETERHVDARASPPGTPSQRSTRRPTSAGRPTGSRSSRPSPPTPRQARHRASRTTPRRRLPRRPARWPPTRPSRHCGRSSPATEPTRRPGPLGAGPFCCRRSRRCLRACREAPEGEVGSLSLAQRGAGSPLRRLGARGTRPLHRPRRPDTDPTGQASCSAWSPDQSVWKVPSRSVLR